MGLAHGFTRAASMSAKSFLQARISSLFAIFLALAMICTNLGANVRLAYALDDIDLKRLCTLVIKGFDNNLASIEQLQVFRVATISLSDSSSATGSQSYNATGGAISLGGVQLTLTEDFKGLFADKGTAQISYAEDDWPMLAAELSDYARGNSLQACASAPVENTVAKFSDLEAGLYLVMDPLSNVSADSLNTSSDASLGNLSGSLNDSLQNGDGALDNQSTEWDLAPFLVQLPCLYTADDNGEPQWQYEITCQAKTAYTGDLLSLLFPSEGDKELINNQDESSKLANSTAGNAGASNANSSDASAASDSGASSTLPQTGMLLWPIPVLLFFGLAFVLLALYLRRSAHS